MPEALKITRGLIGKIFTLKFSAFSDVFLGLLKKSCREHDLDVQDNLNVQKSFMMHYIYSPLDLYTGRGVRRCTLDLLHRKGKGALPLGNHRVIYYHLVFPPTDEICQPTN